METWGISGPAFLAVYVGLLALTAAAVVADRARADRRGRGAGAGDLDDYDVAVLNGEAGLAASVALLALDRAGAVELADRMVRELAESQDLDLGSLTGGTLSEKGLGMEVMLGSPLGAYAHPVEAEVYKAVERSSSRRAGDILAAAAAGLPAIAVVRRRLAALGLLRPPAEVDRRARQWVWFVPVLLLGTVRLAYGLSRGKPVICLVGLLVLTVVAMIIMATRAVGTRTRRGDRLFDEMRKASRGGTSGSAGTLTAREDAGHLLAVGGWDGLWSADRPLALAVGAGGLAALEAEQQASSFWSSRGGGSSSGGGCGSSGGGCSSGGGGGCGGGGGGCGGGGCGG